MPLNDAHFVRGGTCSLIKGHCEYSCIADSLPLQEEFLSASSAGRMCLIANRYVRAVNIAFFCLVTLNHMSYSAF